MSRQLLCQHLGRSIKCIPLAFAGFIFAFLGQFEMQVCPIECVRGMIFQILDM
jgi:hypothetical protein